MKITASAGVWILVCSLLIPLYKPFGLIGYGIAVISAIAVALCTFFIAGKRESQKMDSQATEAQTLQAVQASNQQLVKLFDSFTEQTALTQANFQQAMQESQELQQATLKQLQAASDGMISIAREQQAQSDRICDQLDTFTSKLTSLFEQRLQEDMESIRSIKVHVADNLTALRTETGEARQRQLKYQERLESVYQGISSLLVNHHKGMANELKQVSSELKITVGDTLDDMKEALEDILKAQRKDSRSILEDILTLHRSLMEELSIEGKRHQESLVLMQRLQEEILDLNKQDMQLISKLMQEA